MIFCNKEDIFKKTFNTFIYLVTLQLKISFININNIKNVQNFHFFINLKHIITTTLIKIYSHQTNLFILLVQFQ